MNNEQNINSADIVISDDVIEKIAKTATLEVDGVVSVTTSLRTDIIDKISKKNHNRGVSIIKENDDISITISCYPADNQFLFTQKFIGNIDSSNLLWLQYKWSCK